jgi:hypothetical protein
MKEKIERFSRGEFEYELPYVCLSEEEIELTVEAGKAYEGTFTISNSIGRPMQGCVYSSNRLMQIANPEFQEAVNTIAYHFNAQALRTGSETKGEFHIISDCRELSLPFRVQTEAPYCMSSLGKIKDLFQFTNLAKTDWSEAKRIFKSEEFQRIFLDNEEQYKVIYQNLLDNTSTSQALEEFLIAVHKKASVRLEIDKTQVEYNVLEEIISDKLTLTRSQWGYSEIRVNTDAPFLKLEQKLLWADQFEGNTQSIFYTINPKLLRCGNNFGHIWITTAHQTITATILCKYRRADRKAKTNRLKQKGEFTLADAYLSFRLKRINYSEYWEETEAIIEKLPGPEISYSRDLLKTYLAVISGKNNLAEEFMSDFAKEEAILKKRSIPEYCAYLYLVALYRKDDAVTLNAADTLRGFYTNGYHDWRILWFLLYTDKLYERNKKKKLEDIKEQFDLGCRSPVLYYEAVCIINEEPYLMNELSDFEIQVLNYGIKNWILSREAANQYTYLAGKKKAFHPLIFRGLLKLYDEFDQMEILSAICSLLIKGMKKSEKYHEWYRLGAEAQLHITGLYEYYMYSIGDSQQNKVAQPVLLYFIYNSNLSDAKKAFLYSGVVKNRDINEAVYRSYYKKMEVFTLKMLESHHINRDLAILYHEFLGKITIGPEESKHLPYILYRNELICNNPNMVSAIVLHKEFNTEECVQLKEGKAQVDIYSGNAAVFFADTFGNRYYSSVEYTLTPYMNAEEYEKYCIEYCSHPMLLLHLFDRYQSYRILNSESIELRKKVLMMNGLSKEYITYCCQTLIDYYYENYDDELLDNYLKQLELDYVRQNERSKYIELMMIRGLYQKALKAIEKYGAEGTPLNRVVKLCSGFIKLPDTDTIPEDMVNLCYYVFSQDKYDEAVLRCLIDTFSGSTREMYRVWQASMEFELPSHDLEERLLMQILFAGSYIEDSYRVFFSYYKEVTNHVLVRAFLSYYAYRYLVHDQLIDRELFPIMKRELFYEENDVCLLAWLKYNAAQHSLSDSEIVFAEYNIMRLVRKGITLPFYFDYKDILNLPDQILDKLYIYYHADPRKRIYIHYRLSEEDSQEYTTQRLPNIFMGIHGMEFVLFYHEGLQYYITEEMDEDTNITESYNVHYECEVLKEDEANYSSINLMLMAVEMQDDTTLLGLMEDYAKREYMISACFRQLD